MGRLLRGLRRFSWQHMDEHRIHPQPPPQPHRQLGHLHQPSYPINTSTNSKPKPPTLLFSLTTLALATGIYATIHEPSPSRLPIQTWCSPTRRPRSLIELREANGEATLQRLRITGTYYRLRLLGGFGPARGGRGAEKPGVPKWVL